MEAKIISKLPLFSIAKGKALQYNNKQHKTVNYG